MDGGVSKMKILGMDFTLIDVLKVTIIGIVALGIIGFMCALILVILGG